MESCISCSRVVSGRQQAVECDVCGKWQHRTCDTGISLKTYREAVKNGGSLTFVCRPCLVKENISEDDDGPPVLELSIPVHNESQDETMIYEQPPLLELSVMLPMTDVTVIFEETNLDEPPTLDTGADMYMIETILDDSHFQDTSIIEDMYMPEARDEDPVEKGEKRLAPEEKVIPEDSSKKQKDPVEKGEKRLAPEEKAISDDSSKKQKTEGNDSRKRKCAIIFGYNGKGYHGLQRNPGFSTIEEALCKALMTADLIPKEHFEYMQKTVLEPRIVSTRRIFVMPERISIFYLRMPFYRKTRLASNSSAKRFIMDFECRTPFVRHGVEFCVISVKGQSFMMHQIRKMVGTVIAVLKGYIEQDFIEETFKHEKICLPKAPGLGLVLDKLHYQQYNKRFGSDHKKINFEDVKEKAQPFIEEAILSDIYKTEFEEYSMLKWLPELEIFTFDVENGYRQDDKMKLKDERSLITNKFIYGPDYKPPEQAEVLDNGPNDQSTDPKIDSSANQEAVCDDSTNEKESNLSNEKETSVKLPEKTACDEVKEVETEKIESAIEETAR